MALKVEVIVTYTTPAIRAAKQSTTTIPIVMANVGDPIATGSRKPGPPWRQYHRSQQSFTSSWQQAPRNLKRGISENCVAIFWNPEAHAPALKELENVAPALRVQLRSVTLRTIDDIESAFETAVKGQSEGLIALELGN